jgi:hypothetical protein
MHFAISIAKIQYQPVQIGTRQIVEIARTADGRSGYPNAPPGTGDERRETRRVLQSALRDKMDL